MKQKPLPEHTKKKNGSSSTQEAFQTTATTISAGKTKS
jgi:hypothetical protein